jgi:hypothetical protein
VIIVLIIIKRRETGFEENLPPDFKLVLLVYYIPFFGFLLYLTDLILTTADFLSNG